MSTYKPYYFNFRGRAEVARLIFALAGQKFDNIRFEHDQWPSYKAEMSLGQVPVLELDGTKLPQSISIARFLAKRFQLASKDTFEQAKVDIVADTNTDLMTAFIPIRRKQLENKQQELTMKFFTQALPKHLQNLATLSKLYSNGGPYFVGNNLTWTDLFFYDIGEKLLQADENCLNNYPWLRENRAEVEKQPRLAEYLKNRPSAPY